MPMETEKNGRRYFQYQFKQESVSDKEDQSGQHASQQFSYPTTTDEVKQRLIDDLVTAFSPDDAIEDILGDDNEVIVSADDVKSKIEVNAQKIADAIESYVENIAGLTLYTAHRKNIRNEW